MANSEKLPFEDASFKSYTANLSLMIVANHMNMLREAYRVLEPGSAAAFTVWGKEENCSFLTLRSEAALKIGKMKGPPRSNFHLGNDAEKLKEQAISVGFKDAVTWYSSIFSNYRCKEDYLETTMAIPQFKSMPGDLLEKVMAEIGEGWEKYTKEKGGIGVEFQALFLVAYK